MQSFDYYSPTRILFGKDAVEQAGQQMKALGCRHICLIHGSGSVKTGLLERVQKLLVAEGLPYSAFGGVRENPVLSYAEQCVAQAEEAGCDSVLAIGGGSVLDTAKGVAIALANPGVDLWQMWLCKAPIANGRAPLGVIETIAASGSDNSRSAVLTNEATGQKRGLNSEINRPDFSILDPVLTYTVPDYQLRCGIVDTMMHTIERYFTNKQGNLLTDAFAEALLLDTITAGRRAVVDKTDYDAMSELLWCSSLSHNDLTGLGGEGDFAPHQLGQELGAMFDVVHGASLSAVWSTWARFVLPHDVARFALFARRIWGITDPDDARAALAGIEASEAYFRSLGMPVGLSELGIGILPEETLRELAERTTIRNERPTVGHFVPLDCEAVYQIFQLCNF